ncbi:MAG: glycosyltransferase [Desulfarculales bacterium]|jgi:tetratricopeptide (TPR) repeat protein|nr:glycosyltransferase [Desulfarculales bacterium]
MAVNKPLKSAPGRRLETVSVCMMVKNEEKRLGAALASVREWVDEIIVVDTGSTDRTVEIAESFGAKIYHHPWEYNFSKHRNQSMQYAGCNWIFILDADEELAEGQGPLLRKLMENPPPHIHCFLMELNNTMPGGNSTFLMHPRLFRNHVGFHYEGKVHNRPILTGPAMATKILLLHHGYNEDDAVMDIKHKRRILMIRKWVEEEPENLHARSYLAHTLQSSPEGLNESIEQALIGLELLSHKPPKEQADFGPHLYYPLLNCLTSLNRDDEAIKYAGQCMDLAPNYPDSLFFLCQIYFKRAQWQELYDTAVKFLDLQSECRRFPERFIYYENLSAPQENLIRARLIQACAHLGREDEAEPVFNAMFGENDSELTTKLAVQGLIKNDFGILARSLTNIAQQKMPQWPWPPNFVGLVEIKSQEQQAGYSKQEGLRLLEENKPLQALPLLEQANHIMPNDGQVMLAMARIFSEQGQREQALPWLIGGLNAHPGHPWAWQALADYYFESEQYLPAQACYQRYLSMARSDPQARQRYEQSLNLSREQTPVRMKPPKLLFIMAGGLSPKLLQQPAPHFLMGRAWGEFLTTGFESQSDPMWAALLTGSNQFTHGIFVDSSWSNPFDLSQSKAPCIWEVLPPHLRLGFAAMPLDGPGLKLPGWSLPGYPHGILHPNQVRPNPLAGLALAHGYRSDYLLSNYDEQMLHLLLFGNVIQEAFMAQMERNKIVAAMNMPAVDVLILGFNALDYQQRVHGLAQYATYSIYQQFYGWVETLLAALQPENFAIVSQRGLGQTPNYFGGGAYVLSWLKGENGQANITDIAPALADLLGGDKTALGRPRS